jgi:phosphoenolpyruvate-protein kinase (PTS system EI component)
VTPRQFTGIGVADGAAAGRLFLADARPASEATAGQVAAAFAAVAADRAALAERLRAEGRDQQADIIGVAALIAADRLLVEPAVAAIRAGTDAATAITASAQTQAAKLAALNSPELAERASDVRQVAQAVLEHLAGGKAERPEGAFILVRREVAAADLIELADEGLAGMVSVAGGASSHAAIVARGLGLPMLTGVDETVLAGTAGQLALLDADAGLLTINPPEASLAALAGPHLAVTPQPAPSAAAALAGHRPAAACTSDGVPVVVLCNVASAAETRRGLAAGAAGVGLLRTEIPFTSAAAWPGLDQHEQQLTPILGLLTGRTATVRLLDFSGDKIPPFLPAGKAGLAALLSQPAALASQLRAALIAGRDTDLAILIPMVAATQEIAIVRDAIAAVAAELGTARPRLGIMVELAATAATAETFASEADFFSIGTNDLTGDVLGLGRLDPAAGPKLAADPRVLELIAHVTDVAAAAGIPVSVCGDSAADRIVLPLLIGLGVRTVSVPAAKVGQVREWIGGLDAAACAVLAAKARTVSSAPDAWELVQRADLS